MALRLGLGLGLGRKLPGGSLSSSSPITIDLQTSRISGVAPLSVFFDASGTTCTGIARPFHHLGYTWNFDDAGSLLPTANGPLAAHVFDAPGTYDVAVTVVDENGDTTNDTVTVTVTDPDTVFAGTDTICFSNSGTFTGAPSGCTQVTTSSFDTALTYAGNGKRLLFARGDTFTSVSPGTVNITTGPASFGAFGTGTSPDERGIFTNNPVISCQRGSDFETAFAWYGTDIRVCDLTFVEGDTEAQTCSALNTVGRCVDTLVHRCKTSGFRTSMGYSHDLMEALSLDPHEANTISQCWFEDSRVTTTYCGGHRLAFLGNFYDTNLSSHLCRVTFAQQMVVHGNRLEYPGATRHALKVHAAQTKATYGDYTEQVVITENRVTANGAAWPIALAPEDGGPNDDERLRDVIVDRNIVIAEDGVQIGVYLGAIQSTVRNLVVTRPEGWAAASLQGVWVVKRGTNSPTPSEIEIYGVTLNDESPGATTLSALFLETGNYTGSALLKLYNCIVNAPGATELDVYGGGDSDVDSQGNVIGGTFNFTDTSLLDFHPEAGSDALGAGVSVPNFYDFDGTTRAHADAGAYERA